MKIAESAVLLYANHTSVEKNTEKESLTVWQNGRDAQTLVNEDEGPKLDVLMELAFDAAAQVSLSPQARQMMAVSQEEDSGSGSDDPMVDLKLRILQDMIERLTGRKIGMARGGRAVLGEKAHIDRAPAGDVQAIAAQPGSAQGQRSGMGAIYEQRLAHYESERTQFTAQGTILTQDGKQIDFSAQLTMSREFSSEQSRTLRIGAALKDPLVLNFQGTATQLTQTRFAFDLNADGQNEQIAFVAPGSGFLALDKNGDGSINNGSELFGPGTGNGFAELGAYDRDGNNWIDENDPVFGELKIWSKDSEGRDQLFTLGQLGIGALYLGNVATPFSMKNQENQLAGQVRSSGIFLKEDGGVGTLQQIDLVV